MIFFFSKIEIEYILTLSHQCAGYLQSLLWRMPHKGTERGLEEGNFSLLCKCLTLKQSHYYARKESMIIGLIVCWQEKLIFTLNACLRLMLASNRLGHCELRFLVMKKLVLKNSGILGFRTSKGNENNWFFKKSVQFKKSGVKLQCSALQT